MYIFLFNLHAVDKFIFTLPAYPHAFLSSNIMYTFQTFRRIDYCINIACRFLNRLSLGEQGFRGLLGGLSLPF